VGHSKISKICAIILLIAILIVVCYSELGVNASEAPEKSWSARTWFHLRSIDTNSPSGNSLASTAPTGFSPAQVQKAYNLQSTGDNVTIAIVDAYDYPTAQNDFATFSTQFGLPTGNFEKHLMPGTNTFDQGWALEEALDIQWAHAIAPNARILLVEAKSPSFADLIGAINYATSRQDVVAVSMSWGGSEFNGQQTYDSLFTSNHGIVFFASSGDSGAGVMWPSTSSNVAAVGGTTLNLSPNGSVASETAWSGSGGGISAYEKEPSYQLSYGVNGTNGKRAVPDISYDADPNTGFSVYDSTAYSGQIGWFQVGGTSAGAPQWAAIRSLGLSASNDNFYVDAKNQTASYFRDITSGSNGAYSASQGYDLVTGLGSPVTYNYNPNQDFTVSIAPSNLTITNGSSSNSTVAVTSVNGFYGNVTLSAFVPAGWTANFTPQSVNVPFGGNISSLLYITVNSTAKSGTYQIVSTGTTVSLNHNASIRVNVKTLPFPPQNLNATNDTSQIILNWTAPSDSGGLNITGYNVYRGITSGGETKLASLGGNVSRYVDSQVSKGQTYFYIVTDNNSLGESAKSGEVNSIIQNNYVILSSFAIQSSGSGYTTPVVLLVGGGGSGASATARVSNGAIIGIVLTNPGSGYSSAPNVVFRDPSPRAGGATAKAITILAP
jgi:subtilase family serine protease